VSGINAAMTYRWGGGRNGNFSFGLNYNNTLKHEVQNFPDEDSIDYLRNPFYSSEFKTVLSGDFTWEVGKWDTAVHMLRYGSTPNYTAQIGADVNNGIGPGTVAPYMLFNTSVGYQVTDNSRVSLTVNNIGNRKAPRDDSWTAYPYYNIFNYNGYGRAGFLQYSIDLDAN
jgi:outer membrane receptor protein involved in Fe transport